MEPYAWLEDGISTGGPPRSDNAMGEAPSVETTVVLLLSARQFNLVIGSPSKLKGPDRLVLNSLIKLMKCDHPLTDPIAPGPNAAQLIINHWNPFNKRDASVVDMRELYPISLRIPVVAFFEEYSIPFPGYLDKKSYQCVVEDGMHIRNHDFNETAELVWSGF